MSQSPGGLHALPIVSRPSLGFRQCIRGLIWAVVFNAGCLMVHGSQLVFLLPLRLLIIFVPIPLLQRLYEAGVRWTKGSFGKLVVLMCQWFSPTRVILTFEGNNLKEEDVVVREPAGRVVKLHFPQKLVLIANHQIYADWWYLWCLTYRAEMHKDVLIILKKSLKWIPVVGWGMQIYHFIFVARSWASDRLILSEKLSKLAARTQIYTTPLAFMIFPEGTLVSKLTRPVSKKFAEKSGIEDMQNTLLPRSTGLHYCLRSLSPQIPDLQLLDVTIAYEGIPPRGYGQSYYTLRSIFMDGIPPPRIHMHLRLYDVRRDLPLGDLVSSAVPALGESTPSSIDPPDSRTSYGKAVDPTSQEATEFELWLRKLWREKDALIERYFATGTFLEHPKTFVQEHADHSTKESCVAHSGEVEIPMELFSKWEIPDAFSLFAPLVAWIVCRKIFGAFCGYSRLAVNNG